MKARPRPGLRLNIHSARGVVDYPNPWREPYARGTEPYATRDYEWGRYLAAESSRDPAKLRALRNAAKRIANAPA